MLTNFGLSLLLGIVIVITGVYGGLIDDALRQARAANADLWVVEAGTNGPFAKSSRIPGDTRELSPGSMASSARVSLPTNRFKPCSTASRSVSSSSATGRPQQEARKLLAGRDIIRSHYEMVVDRSAGLASARKCRSARTGTSSPSSA